MNSHSRNIVYAVTFSLPMMLHCIGLVLLYKAKGKLPHQRMVTMNLAAAEMIYCLWRAAWHIMNVTDFFVWIRGIVPNASTFFSFVSEFLFVNIRFAYILIIADRFLFIWLNIKYYLYITKHQLRLVIIAQWLLAILTALVVILFYKCKVLNYNEFIRTRLVIHIALDTLISSTALFTFSYLFLRVKGITKESDNQQKVHSGMFKIWMKLKVPGLMVITFVIFNVSSTILKFIDLKFDYKDLRLIITIYTLTILGWCFDSIIYILLQKRVRKLVYSMTKRRSKVYSVDTRPDL